MKHLLTVNDVNNDDLLSLFREAELLRKVRNGVRFGLAEMKATGLENKVMASLFFEPSTRTRMSFEVAMMRLRGTVSCAPEGRCLSLTKGESLPDTIEVVARLTDVIVVRSTSSHSEWFHPGSNRVPVPVINAGDGPHNHPTQALLDAYTIWREIGAPARWPFPMDTKSHLVIGDLGKSRTIKSYVELFLRQSNHRIHLFDSTLSGAKVPGLDRWADLDYIDAKAIDDLLPHTDYLYLNRVQTERHEEAKFENWQITERQIKKMKPTALILNPGPRKEELPFPLCCDERVKMNDQVENGMFVRMALLRKLCS